MAKKSDDRSIIDWTRAGMSFHPPLPPGRQTPMCYAEADGGVSAFATEKLSGAVSEHHIEAAALQSGSRDDIRG
jgi:hypothetical protein